MHLKDLLVSQLGLIQQQSETILSYDKQLKTLRIENEHLRQRLERMERRVRGSDHNHPGPPPPGGDDAAKPPAAEAATKSRKRLQPPDSHAAATPGGPHTNKRQKRAHSEADTKNGGDKKVDTAAEFPRFDDLTDEIYEEEGDDPFRLADEPDGDPPAERLRGTQPAKNSASAASHPVPKSEKPSRAARKSRKAPLPPPPPVLPAPPVAAGGPLEPLLTPYHYFVGCRKDVVNKDDKLNEVAALQRGVEVPKWREDKEYEKRMGKTKKTSSSSRQKDGAEGLEDVVFLKRHEKPEVSEKRQKKWDIQRNRERSYCEKLRARYRAAERRKETEPESLLPGPEAVEKVLVVQDGKVPVTAFGEAVPALPHVNFALPWLAKSAVPPKNENVSRRTRHSMT